MSYPAPPLSPPPTLLFLQFPPPTLLFLQFPLHLHPSHPSTTTHTATTSSSPLCLCLLKLPRSSPQNNYDSLHHLEVVCHVSPMCDTHVTCHLCPHVECTYEAGCAILRWRVNYAEGVSHHPPPSKHTSPFFQPPFSLLSPAFSYPAALPLSHPHRRKIRWIWSLTRCMQPTLESSARHSVCVCV